MRSRRWAKRCPEMVMAFLVFTLGPRAARADTLTYYVYPAPLGISWANPSALSWSTLFNNLVVDNRFKNLHAIGHVNFDLSCDPSPELPSGARIVTGQTNSDNSQMTDFLFEQGYGLEILLANYEGRWETQQEIEEDLPARFETGLIDFMRFRISAPTCARVVSYLSQYVARGYDKIYGGLEDRPRYGEGAGCSAFGESVLEIAGLMAPEWQKDWQRSVIIPEDLIGGPTTQQSVSALDLLFGFSAMSWSKSPDHGYSLTFWDPARMYGWIRRAWDHSLPLTGMSYAPVARAHARGLRIDATSVPTPTDDFWLSTQEFLGGGR